MNKIVYLLFLLSVTLGLASTSLAAAGQTTKITLKVSHEPLVSVLEKIQKQTGMNFIYNERIVKDIKDITLDVTDVPLDTVMAKVLKGTNLHYEIQEKIIVITAKETSATAIGRRVHGTVRDDQGNVIPGVTVLVKGTTIGVATGIDGRFSLDLPATATSLVFSFVGMQQQDVKIPGGNAPVNVVMTLANDELDEVVITGFQSTTRRKATGSVAVVPMEIFTNKANPTIDNLLQGQVAGVNVTAISGRPGETSRVRIRGTSTLSGDAEPLWVIDGVPMQRNFSVASTGQIKAGDFNDIFINGIGGINPNDIESITILKDASATAIYGSRAAGGVIVVSTKRGKIGNMTINYAANVTVGLKPQRDPNLMNAREKLDWEQELWDEFAASQFALPKGNYPVVGMVGMLRAGKIDENGKYWNEEGFVPMTTAEQDAYIERLGQHSTDWFGELFRNSVSTAHHLSVSGGSEKAAYYVSLGYTKDNGLVKRTGYDRYSLNSNLTMTPGDRVKLEVGLDLSQQKYKGYSGNVDLFKYAYFANPYETPYNADGSYRADFTYGNLSKVNGDREINLPPAGLNILRELDETSTRADNFATTLRLNLEYTLIEGLKFNGLVSYGFANYKTNNINGPGTYAAFNDRLPFDRVKKNKTYGSIYQTSENNTNYSARGFFSYSGQWGDNHQFVAFAGAELRGDQAKGIFAKRYGYDPVTGNSSMPMPDKPESSDQVDYSTIEGFAMIVDKLSGQTEEENRFASFFASLDYNFMKRYVASFSFRTDGSNNFGSDQQFNPTWSVGLAWHVTDEAFMHALDPLVSHLTLRLAGGYTGNISKASRPQLVMSYEDSYRKSENLLRMARVVNAPNPDLRWEKTRDMKIALDFGFLEERVTGLVEAYHRRSEDVVTDVRVPLTTGFSRQGYNTSIIENKGIEGTLKVEVIKRKELKVRLSGNIAWNRNEVLDYKSPGGTLDSDVCEGFPLGAIFTGKIDEIDELTGFYNFQLRPDAILKNGSDLHDGDNYRLYAGTKYAPYTGGFNLQCVYKNLSLNVGGSFVLDAKIMERLKSPANHSARSGPSGESYQVDYNDLYRNHLNVSRDMTDRWTTERRTGTKYPRVVDYFGEQLGLGYYNVTDAEIVRGAYLENVAFARIRDITLGYQLPSTMTRRLGISSLNFALTLNNFFTFTNYSGIDPETPTTTYPLTRSVTFGLNLGF